MIFVPSHVLTQDFVPSPGGGMEAGPRVSCSHVPGSVLSQPPPHACLPDVQPNPVTHPPRYVSALGPPLTLLPPSD